MFAGLSLRPNLATWGIAALAPLGVIVRPFSWPEAIWAVLGAALLVGALSAIIPLRRVLRLDPATAFGRP